MNTAWEKVNLRPNAQANMAGEAEIQGSYLSKRIALDQKTPAGSYNHVVDASGNVWLGPRRVHHSALVEAGAEVRSAGQIVVTADGTVHANTVSGHYMRRMPLARGQESAWIEAFEKSLEDVGLKRGQLFPDTRSLKRFAGD